MASHRKLLLASTAAACLFTTFQATARQIKSIKILEYGINANPEIKELNKECLLFKPSIKQVKNYLLKAYSAPRRLSHERWSSCYTSGTAEFEDFGKINWTIGSGGTGAIEWSEDEYVYIFYKYNRWLDPTACTYGLGDKGEC
ncbi:hypothetical protein [Comamonas composti]|uniref:hypothetical protein n=1 Tax=Comamonas composti TaxID=408558 RepID=UPI0012EB9A60|nr:hypothetical protein [Comamonas composti]